MSSNRDILCSDLVILVSDLAKCRKIHSYHDESETRNNSHQVYSGQSHYIWLLGLLLNAIKHFNGNAQFSAGTYHFSCC